MDQKNTIYYVDDDEDDLNVFNEAISMFGHVPALFSDGYQMLAHLEGSKPHNDIIFIDLNMPTISGYDLIKAIRNSEKFSKVPIISYSTAKDDVSVNLAKDAGADLHVPKSPTYEGLKRSLAYVLGIDWSDFKSNETNFVYSPI